MLVREATQCKDIKVGNSSVNHPQGFLAYPVAWCKCMETLIGLNLDKDVLPVYLTLVMHLNSTIFDGILVPSIENN